jgi:hypothetical protein
MRADGVDWITLRTDADPLRALGRFLARRASERVRSRGVRR